MTINFFLYMPDSIKDIKSWIELIYVVSPFILLKKLTFERKQPLSIGIFLRREMAGRASAFSSLEFESLFTVGDILKKVLMNVATITDPVVR